MADDRLRPSIVASLYDSLFKTGQRSNRRRCRLRGSRHSQAGHSRRRILGAAMTAQYQIFRFSSSAMTTISSVALSAPVTTICPVPGGEDRSGTIRHTARISTGGSRSCAVDKTRDPVEAIPHSASITKHSASAASTRTNSSRKTLLESLTIPQAPLKCRMCRSRCGQDPAGLSAPPWQTDFLPYFKSFGDIHLLKDYIRTLLTTSAFCDNTVQKWRNLDEPDGHF